MRADARNKQHSSQLLTQSPFEKQATLYLTDFARKKFTNKIIESALYGCRIESVDDPSYGLSSMATAIVAKTQDCSLRI